MRELSPQAPCILCSSHLQSLPYLHRKSRGARLAQTPHSLTPQPTLTPAMSVLNKAQTAYLVVCRSAPGRGPCTLSTTYPGEHIPQFCKSSEPLIPAPNLLDAVDTNVKKKMKKLLHSAAVSSPASALRLQSATCQASRRVYFKCSQGELKNLLQVEAHVCFSAALFQYWLPKKLSVQALPTFRNLPPLTLPSLLCLILHSMFYFLAP